MQAPTDAANTQRPYADDEIDLFELVENLWKQKVLILLVTVVVTVLGAGYAVLKTPTYTINAAIGATDNLSASIRLTQLWSEHFSEQELFTTPVIAQYARGETPYSPTSLYLRFAETLASKEFRDRFISEHPTLPSAAVIRSLTVNYPKKIDTQIPLTLSQTTKNQDALKQSAEAINTYLNWAKAEFGRKIQQEAALLSGTDNSVLDKTLFVETLPLVSIDRYAVAPVSPVKPKKMLVIALSVVLGGMAGVMIALVRTAIRSRRESQAS